MVSTFILQMHCGNSTGAVFVFYGLAIFALGDSDHSSSSRRFLPVRFRAARPMPDRALIAA